MSFAKEANDEENGQDVESEVLKKGTKHEPVRIWLHRGTRSPINIALGSNYYPNTHP